MHGPRTQCTLFSVSLHRFSNQNFDNQMPNILTSWLPKSLLLFNTEKKAHGAVLRDGLGEWESVYVQKNELRNQDFNFKFSNLLNQGSQPPELGRLLPKVNGVPSSLSAIPRPPSPPSLPLFTFFIIFFILFFCFFISRIFLFRSTRCWGSMIKLLTPRSRYETACVTHHK